MDYRWGVPILHENINNHIHVESVLKHMATRYKDTRDLPVDLNDETITDLKHQCDLFDETYSVIKSYVDKFFMLAYDRLNVDYRLKVHVFACPKGYNLPFHHHRCGAICGVLYLNVPSGNLLAHDPKFNANRGMPNWMVQDTTLEIKPAPGDIIIFPSYVYHQTTPNTEDKLRMCMPFDVHVGD